LITDRDKVIIQFITNIPCYSNTIHKIFFPSQRTANKRLTHLFESGYIKRSRKHASEFYFYWAGRREPADKHKKHFDLIARAYWWVTKQNYNVLNIDIQKKQGKVKPDLLLHIEKDGRTNILPVEIERSNNIINTVKKYEDTEFKKLLLFCKRSFTKTTHFIEVIDINLKELD
jgi:hypothetical protein